MWGNTFFFLCTPEDTAAQSGSSTLTLVYNNIKRTQSGIYTCTVSVVGVTETAETNVTLDIQFAAKVLSFTPDNSTVTINFTLALNCTYEGNPSPNVLWYHNGSELVDIENDTNLSETINGSSSLLDVIFTNINISGEYHCVANNSIGMDQSTPITITVHVLLSPTPSSTSTTSSSANSIVNTTSSKGISHYSTSSAVYTMKSSSIMASSTTTENPPGVYIVPVVIVGVIILIVISIVLVMIVCVIISRRHSKEEDEPIHASSNNTVTTSNRILTVKGDSTTNTYTMVVKQSKIIHGKDPLEQKEAETKHTDHDGDDPPPIIPFDHTIPEPDIGEPLPLPTYSTLNDINASKAHEEMPKEMRDSNGTHQSSRNIVYAELSLIPKIQSKSSKTFPTHQFKDDKVIYSTIHTNEIPPPIAACKVTEEKIDENSNEPN